MWENHNTNGRMQPPTNDNSNSSLGNNLIPRVTTFPVVSLKKNIKYAIKKENMAHSLERHKLSMRKTNPYNY